MRLLVDQKQCCRDEGDDETLPPWKPLDWDLHELPTAVWNGDDDFWIDWTYLVDLDSELFIVNNWIVFNLWNIPRDRWTEAFGVDEFSFELCPEASAGISQARYFTNADEPQGFCVTIYRQHAVSWVNPRRINEPLPLRQLFMLAIFHQFITSQSSLFSDYLLATVYDSFAFREVAYAVLSFATGKFYLDTPSRYIGSYTREKSTGFLVDMDDEGEPILMPIFGSGCHTEDEEPGSSPSEPIFWFQDVLISLIPNNAFDLDIDAIIGKAILFGRASGRDNFQIVLFSIENAVLLEVYDSPVAKIRRSEIIPICDPNYYKMKCICNKTNKTDTCGCSMADLLRTAHWGFVALQDFFAVVSRRDISDFGCGRLPVEIYAKILKHCDLETYNSCRNVSRTFQALCDAHFPFSGGLNILGLESSGQKKRVRRSGDAVGLIHLAELGNFHFYNKGLGVILRSPLDVQDWNSVDEKKIETCCPVIGGYTRPSIVTQTSLRLMLKA